MGKSPFTTQRRLSLAVRSTKCQRIRYLFPRRLSSVLVRAAESTRNVIAQQVGAHIVNTIVDDPPGVANIQMQKTGAEAFVSAVILPASDLERSA